MKKMLLVVLMIASLMISASCWSQANPERGDSITLTNENLTGDLFTNGQPTNLYRNGFRPFCLNQNPDKNIFMAGFYFEHIYNGTLADDYRSMFAPEKTPCHANQLSTNSGQMIWYGNEGQLYQGWDIDATETFALNGQGVGLNFQATINEESTAPLGYLAFMWASYVNMMAIERNIHFFGVDMDNHVGWQSLGDDYYITRPDGNSIIHRDIGANPYVGAKNLTMENGVGGMNIMETGFRYIHPFYYGFMDGDGDFNTTDDTIVFVAMFDSADIRLALYSPGDNTHSPAWDWQLIIRDPQLGQTYGFNAKFLFVPIEQILADVLSREDLMINPPEELNDWMIGTWKSWLASFSQTPPNAPPAIIFADQTINDGLYHHHRLPLGTTVPTGPEAFAVDDQDGVITDRPINYNFSQANLNVVGTYPYSSSVADSKGLIGKRDDMVDVLDDTPNIWFGGVNQLVLMVNNDHYEVTATAFSPYSDELPVKLSDNINFAVLGNYTLTGSTTSKTGIMVTSTIPVKVVTGQPQISFSCSRPLFWCKGVTWTEPEATAWNDFYGDLTSSITLASDNVNTKKTGQYQVIYKATSPNGDTATETLRVIVVPKFLYKLLLIVTTIIGTLLGS